MNASVHLLHRSVPTTLHLRAAIPADHASAGILGNERMGTAIALRDTGLALTAHYVVVGASEVEATAVDGTSSPGKVEAIDFETGVAVVSVGGARKAGAVLRADDDLAVGEDVFLIASVGEGRRVNSGTVSSIGPFEAFWEYGLDRAITTTADNPGLPGGPLLDRFGRVAGIIALSLAEVGKPTLAIPVAAARALLDAVSASKAPRARPFRAWLGVTCYPLRHHVVIAGVLPGSPAEAAGLESGDLVLAVDDEVVGDRRSLYSRIWQRRSGDRIRLRLLRAERSVEVEVVTGAVEDYFA